VRDRGKLSGLFDYVEKLTTLAFFDRARFSITLEKPPSYASPWIANP
jgi:hypothetical protein